MSPFRGDDEEEFEDGWTSYNEQAVEEWPAIQTGSGFLKLRILGVKIVKGRRYRVVFGEGRVRGGRGTAS